MEVGSETPRVNSEYKWQRITVTCNVVICYAGKGSGELVVIIFVHSENSGCTTLV